MMFSSWEFAPSRLHSRGERITLNDIVNNVTCLAPT